MRMRVGAAVMAVLAILIVAGGAEAAVPPGSIPVGDSWQTNGRVQTIVVVGSTAYVGGEFTSVRPSGSPLGTGEVVRNHAYAVNVQTVKAKTNGSVNGLAIGPNGLFLGGAFTTADKVTANHLAEVDLSTGALVPGWTASTDQKVTAIALTADGARLIVAGNFLTINN